NPAPRTKNRFRSEVEVVLRLKELRSAMLPHLRKYFFEKLLVTRFTQLHFCDPFWLVTVERRNLERPEHGRRVERLEAGLVVRALAVGDARIEVDDLAKLGRHPESEELAPAPRPDRRLIFENLDPSRGSVHHARVDAVKFEALG